MTLADISGISIPRKKPSTWCRAMGYRPAHMEITNRRIKRPPKEERRRVSFFLSFAYLLLCIDHALPVLVKTSAHIIHVFVG